jgi:hypothetical protein
MVSLIFLLVCILLQLVLLGLAFRLSAPVGDHYYHLGIIKAIKKNRHRLVAEHPNILYEDNFAYPQALHWVHSFFPLDWVRRNYMLPSVLFSVLQTIILWFLSVPWFSGINASNPEWLQFAFVLLVVQTPFGYAVWNSKLNGFSARPLGITLSYLFLFTCMSVVGNPDDYGYHLLLILLVTATLFASQFAHQFLLLCLPFLAIGYGDLRLLMDYFFGLGLFLLIGGKVARQYLKGQWAHKVLYFKYLYHKNILRNRATIWRDLVWDMWLYLKNKPWSNLAYFMHNPVVSVLVLMPAHLALVYLFLKGGNSWSEFRILLVPVVVAFGLFVATSFKRTRFLGEPERYVEMVYPFSVLLLVLLLEPRGEVWEFFLPLLLISILLILLQFLQIRYHASVVGTAHDKTHQVISEGLGLKRTEGLRLISNDTRCIDSFMQTEHQIFRPVLTSLKTLGRPFEEFYELKNFRVLPVESLILALKTAEFDRLVLNTAQYGENEVGKLEDNVQLSFLGERDGFRFYSILERPRKD